MLYRSKFLQILVYPELYAIVGSSVPDYRGYFLRGYGGNSAGLGVQQEDAIRNITGLLTTSTARDVQFLSDSSTQLQATGALSLEGQTTRWTINDGGTKYSTYPTALSFDGSRVVTTANENRPINKSVKYLIRARP